MIRSLRRRHRWMIVGVALVVVLLYVAAIASRPERAIQDSLPEESLPEEIDTAARPGGGNG